MENIPKSILLRNQLTDCRGYHLVNRINQFYLTNYIFTKNYEELLTIIKKQIEPSYSIELMKYENRKECEKFQIKTIRLLHNYITSAISLVDHTRVFVREVYSQNESFMIEYDDKIKETFANNPLSIFIKCFRQYIQHFQTPIIATVTNITDNEEDLETKIVISKKTLLNFTGWKTLAKSYIDSIENNLDIESTIKQYDTLVNGFYSWFENRQSEIHKKDFDEMSQINIRMLDAQIEELIKTFIKSAQPEVNSFIKEISKYMNEIESKLFLKTQREGQLMYIFSIAQRRNIKLTDKEKITFKQKYSH